MTLETSLELGTSDEITFPFRYCTTCKRLLECVRFNFTRKTCCKCLSKSRDRANLRRCKLQFNTTLLRQRVSETLAKLKASGRRICSSCKVAKKLSSFATKRKTCKTCLEKKRRRNCQHAGQCRHLKRQLLDVETALPLHGHHGEHVVAVKTISMSEYQPKEGVRRSQRVPNVPCAQI